MATTNANDSRPRDNRGKEAKSNENYKPRINRENGKNSWTSGQGSREYKPYSKDGKPFGTKRDDRVGERKPTTRTGNRDYKSGGHVYNKDKDLDDVKHGKGYGRDQRMGDSRSKAGQNKEKEQQPDKIETMIRLEKEKKVMQRKNEELNKVNEKPSKVMMKQRRTNNIDWTKGYAKGLYGDDDEDYTEYM